MTSQPAPDEPGHDQPGRDEPGDEPARAAAAEPWPLTRRAIAEVVAGAPAPPAFHRVAPPTRSTLGPPVPVRIGWRRAVVAVAATATVVAGLVAVARNDSPTGQTLSPADTTGSTAATAPTTPATSTSASAPVSVSADTADTPATGMSARECTSTDPMMRPISPARALGCPDGTPVWVEGIVVDVGDGVSVLCDADVADDPEACAAEGLVVGAGLQPGDSGAFMGTVSNGVLGPTP